MVAFDDAANASNGPVHILDNDLYQAGATLSVSLETQPPNGTADPTISPDTTHTYTQTGTFTVTLTVTNTVGSDTATATVTVLEEDNNVAATVQRISYRFGGQLVATRVVAWDADGNEIDDPSFTGLFHIHGDHLGSVTALSYGPDRPDLEGTLVPDSVARFLPFGGYRGGTPASTNPAVSDRGFTGHKHNDDVGLIYMNARFYVGEVGRFASADTIVPDPMNPQSFNRYSYVYNNPINLLDPTGHCATTDLPDGSFTRDSNDANCWQAYDNLYNFMNRQASWYLDYHGWDAQKWLKAEKYSQNHLEGLLKLHQKQSMLPRACNGGGGNCSSAQWDQMKAQIAGEVAPDAGLIGASGSVGFVDSYTAGLELIFNLDETALFFYDGTGWNLPTPEVSIEPYYTGVVWNLENLEDYKGDFWALSIYANTGAGAELTIFGAPGVIPFSSIHEGTWGVAVKPASGIGVGGSFHQTVYDPLDPLSYLRP